MSAAGVKMETRGLVGSLKSSTLSLTSSQLDDTDWYRTLTSACHCLPVKMFPLKNCPGLSLSVAIAILFLFPFEK